MKAIILSIITRFLYILPNKKQAHKIMYRIKMKKRLDLENPKDFNEKIQYLILTEYMDDLYSNLTDKYKVREFIEKKSYGYILPKLYGIYNSTNEIDINSLPKKFVLKPNNGCGNIFICKSKEKFDYINAYKSLDKAVKGNFAKNSLEYHYSKIEPKIICEEYLNDGSHTMPIDYKFYCYKGKVECILVCTDRENKLKLSYYSPTWEKLDYVTDDYKESKLLEKPNNLNEMIEIAENLSKEFKFVRVDLYSIKKKVFFSELTFTPACGLVRYNTQEALNHLGSLIEL